MLKELHISNYRLFDDLTIPDLGQVNLIAGKNNTGKTALLEALRIWAAGGGSTVVNHVLKTRGEFIPSIQDSYSNLFNTGNTKSNCVIANLEIRKSINEIKPFNEKVYGVKINFPANNGSGQQPAIDKTLAPNDTPDHPQDKSIFVPFNNNNFPLQKLWENIVLTPLEEEIVDILKIVEPRLRRIDVNEENSKVLLEGNPKPAHLKSLGEGMSRMLWLAVALVSAKESKLLLIDEFEAGLHHSIQETLWGKIFQYAKEWDIQVFVTTHSMDTVRTFYYVAARPEFDGLGKFFRLQNSRKGGIEVKTYDEERMKLALELELEPR